MHTNEVLEGKKIYLRSIELSDCTEEYAAGLNDSRVNKYTESRWVKHTTESIKEYVKKTLEADNEYLFAIIEKETKAHIGNYHLGPINENNKYGAIAYVIWNKDCWGKGYIKEAHKLIEQFAFQKLNLHGIWCGAYAGNTRSINSLIKVGWKIEGRQKDVGLMKNGRYEDIILVGLVNENK